METIKENLWELENISDERVRTFIKRLRAKTSKDLIEKCIISRIYDNI